MQNTHLKHMRRLIYVSATLILISYIFFVNESRKEVFYLCSNFDEKTPIAEVKRQLDTVTMSSYESSPNEVNQTITLTSSFALGLFSCTVEFDAQNNVLFAQYQM